MTRGEVVRECRIRLGGVCVRSSIEKMARVRESDGGGYTCGCSRPVGSSGNTGNDDPDSGLNLPLITFLSPVLSSFHNLHAQSAINVLLSTLFLQTSS